MLARVDCRGQPAGGGTTHRAVKMYEMSELAEKELHALIRIRRLKEDSERRFFPTLYAFGMDITQVGLAERLIMPDGVS